jgi:glycosyltransferase involved in cell wall biosynthesis
MHVLQVTPRYFPNIGGVEIVVQKISERLAAKGAQVTVYSVDLTLGLLREQKVNGVSVKRFTPFFGDPLYLPEPKFLTSLRRDKPDIIHVHNVHTLPPFLAALAKHKDQKFLLQPYYHRFGQSSIRNSLFKLYRYGLGNVAFSRLDLVIVNSTYEKKIFNEDFPACKEIVLIPLGMDVNETKRLKHDPVEPKRILYIGALRPYKNVDKVLEGFARLIREESEEYRLVIVGEGSEYDYLVKLAHSLGVAPLVEWKRGLSRGQLLNEYAKTSVFILLSSLESFSLVTYEALMIGVPVVVLNFGALADLVDAGLAEGVDSLDAKEIAGALLRASRKKYTKMNLFLSWRDYSNIIFDVYRRLLENL